MFKRPPLEVSNLSNLGAGDFISSIRLKLTELIGLFKDRCAAIIAEKRVWKNAAFILAGFCALVLMVVVIISILNAAAKKPSDPPVSFPVREIPDDAFFMPEEPDFLPPVILYREQKERWTEEDAAPFWTDPAALDGGA
ncbi:MAG: hypothetical protein LBB98_07180 [Treponema sp.]|jgi:hypothetical protein|nr:hypothetical protein [Treponema sp.]